MSVDLGKPSFSDHAARMERVLQESACTCQTTPGQTHADCAREARETVAFEQLEYAMAGVRLLSRAIREATERGDARAIRGLSNLRDELSADVDRLLRMTAIEAVRHG